MKKKRIELDFGAFVLEAELFDTVIARRFAKQLPCAIGLTSWDRELYGPMGTDLGEENPVPHIPEGGIAYTSNGNYVCIFFGQTPAWPVEHIGQMTGDQWTRLLENPSLDSVVIREKEQA
jgi:hypothetical protein